MAIQWETWINDYLNETVEQIVNSVENATYKNISHKWVDMWEKHVRGNIAAPPPKVCLVDAHKMVLQLPTVESAADCV